MKKVVCISSVLVLIQLCVGMQDDLTTRYSNIARLNERCSEGFLKYSMSHIDYKTAKDDFYRIATDADHVFNYINDTLKRNDRIDTPFIEIIKTYFESAYEAYRELPSDCEPCINVGNHPHRSYIPEEEFLFRFILKICEKPAI